MAAAEELQAEVASEVGVGVELALPLQLELELALALELRAEVEVVAQVEVELEVEVEMVVEVEVEVEVDASAHENAQFLPTSRLQRRCRQPPARPATRSVTLHYIPHSRHTHHSTASRARANCRHRAH